MSDLQDREPQSEARPPRGNASFGWKQGIVCYFDIDGVTIEFRGSSWNGRETVHVEGELVSSKRVFRFSSRHAFSFNGVHYELRGAWRSFSKGIFVLTLWREGVEVDYDEVSIINDDTTVEDVTGWRRALRSPLVVIAASGLAGFAVGYTVVRLLG